METELTFLEIEYFQHLPVRATDLEIVIDAWKMGTFFPCKNTHHLAN